jgi:hypothetical protein
MNAASEKLRACASALCGAARIAPPVRIEPLGGGRNNQVHRIESADGARSVLKIYFRHGEDERDRLGHEWSFACHAWQAGLRALPEPLAMDRDHRAALFAELPGRACSRADVTAGSVAQAAEFLRALNVDRRAIAALPVASEACFTLAEHMATVDRRVARLAAIDIPDSLHGGARNFVTGELLPGWRSVEREIRRRAAQLGIDADQRLREDQVVLSPSDLGFHNALIDGANVAFVDFEYAGRDDPAKLIGDFFNQVECPVPLRHMSLMLDVAAADEEAATRARLLLPLYAVKWTSILLNDFLPAGAARRRFALTGEEERERLVGQLAAARAKLGDSEVMLDA